MGLLLTASLRAEGSKNPKIFLKDLHTVKRRETCVSAEGFPPCTCRGLFCHCPLSKPQFLSLSDGLQCVKLYRIYACNQYSFDVSSYDNFGIFQTFSLMCIWWLGNRSFLDAIVSIQAGEFFLAVKSFKKKFWYFCKALYLFLVFTGKLTFPNSIPSHGMEWKA